MSYSDTFIPTARFFHDMAGAGGINQPDIPLYINFFQQVAATAVNGGFEGVMDVTGFATPNLLSFMNVLIVQGYDVRLVGTNLFVSWN